MALRQQNKPVSYGRNASMIERLLELKLAVSIRYRSLRSIATNVRGSD